MTFALCYWILMLIWLVFGILMHFGFVAGTYAATGGSVLIFILLLLLGWKVFGSPLHQ